MSLERLDISCADSSRSLAAGLSPACSKTAFKQRATPSSNARLILLVIVQQRKHFRPFKFFAAVEEVQFHDKTQSSNFCAQRLGQLQAGVGGAAGGQQVVHDDYFLAGLDSVFVDLQRVNAVFQLITPLGGFCRQLARLADGNETGVQTIGQGRAKDETASFNGQHGVYLGVQIVLGKGIDQRGKPHFVFQQGGDVVKENAFLGEVRHLADELLEVITICHDDKDTARLFGSSTRR